MKLFKCVCGNTLHFENDRCVACGRLVGFDPDTRKMELLAADGSAAPTRELCLNGRQYAVCNWLTPAGGETQYCLACQLNRYVPDLSEPRNVELWARLEAAKRRMLFTLLELRLPLSPRVDRGDLAFEFLADDGMNLSENQFGSPVYTGHNRGTITINLAEADAAWRERMREQMNESYRTLLGHFRHEIGHYYWDVLIRDSDYYNEFRALFGNEKRDYGQALNDHYNAPEANWYARFVSAYASAHPWEDWAESWAHYMHMVDTLETAEACGFVLQGQALASPLSDTGERYLPWEAGYRSFPDVVLDWSRLTVAMNALNRSMGLSDAYPFSFTDPVVAKLAFVHAVIVDSGCPEQADLAATAPS